MRAADGVVTPPVVPRRPRPPARIVRMRIVRMRTIVNNALAGAAIRARSTIAEARANDASAILAPKNGKATECAVMRFLVRIV